jgi:hypothetical protein
MWVPPPWLIYSGLSGAHYASRKARPGVAGQTTKVVRCEKCERRYAYELKRIGRDAKHLADLLETGVEAVPCPACGWYQSDMIPPARRQHRRWMVNLGLCVALALVPVVGVIGEFFYVNSEPQGPPAVPWPIFVASLVCLLAVGVGLIVWKYRLSRKFNPNDGDAEARKRYGQSRATLLAEPEDGIRTALAEAPRRPGFAGNPASSLLGFVCAIVCVVVLAACGGFFGVRAIIRATVAARFGQDLPGYLALMPELPEKGRGQPLPFPSIQTTGKVRGRMVVVNADERRIGDLYFDLPDDLRASKPEEVGAVVLLTWGKIRTSGNGPMSSFMSVEYQRVCQVNVFDWKSKSEIACGTVFGRFPSSNLSSNEESVTGPKPDDADVLKLLTGLPRE